MEGRIEGLKGGREWQTKAETKEKRKQEAKAKHLA